jgi:hypothetical protein
MQIIGVAGVNDSHVATGESMLMGVLLMPGAYAHRHPRGCEGNSIDRGSLNKSRVIRLTGYFLDTGQERAQVALDVSQSC